MGFKPLLTSEQILNQVFKGVSRGYDPLEVDKFLDKVLADYRLIESKNLIDKSELEAKEIEINNLKLELQKLNIEVSKYKANFSNIKPSDNVNADNIELIKRINALEKFLFEQGIDPTTIK